MNMFSNAVLTTRRSVVWQKRRAPPRGTAEGDMATASQSFTMQKGPKIDSSMHWLQIHEAAHA